jgi:hypothetical protein
VGVGRTWSSGHGHEFDILSEALRRASPSQIDRFRAALDKQEPIMQARAIIHEGVPLARTNRYGVKLPDWDPLVTQFRWYGNDARFWIGAQRTPFQIDRIMRAALRKCCDLHRDGYRSFQFCGKCECPEFKIEYGVPVGDDHANLVVTFWIYVPDHWGSEDGSGGDGEGRPGWCFGTFCQVPRGGDAQDRGLPAEDPSKLQREPEAPADGGVVGGREVHLREIVWVPDRRELLIERGNPSEEPPPSEKRRLALLARLPQPDAILSQTDAVLSEPDDRATRERAAPRTAGSPEPTRTASAAAGTQSDVEGVGERGHGVDRGTMPDLDAVDLAGGLYGRLFPRGFANGSSDELLDEAARLADRMVGEDTVTKLGEHDEDENPHIAAIYTYFGQFIDHDLTFDPSSSLQRVNDVRFLVDFRTPRLDLDSLYGRGPRDQPYVYDGDHFALGKPIDLDGRYRPDLPRAQTNAEVIADRTKAGAIADRTNAAVIGDPRNDDHLIISQLTALFMRFHNAVVDGLDHDPAGPARSFAEAHQLVRWHYQWLVVHDFLPTVIGQAKAAQYLSAIQRETGDVADRLRLRLARKRAGAFMPVEFSAAAFRFGHSMVRPAYAINDVAAASGSRTPILPGAAGQTIGETLRGHRPVPANMAIDWKYFLPDVIDPKSTGLPQYSYKIDPKLVEPLSHLDPALLGAETEPRSLAERTLRRSVQLRLPSGQGVARHLHDELEYRDCRVLTRAELELSDEFPLSRESTPLWYYILREAELTRGGFQLGPVGGTLVAEVLLGLLVQDPASFLHQRPGWTPSLGARPGVFRLADLVALAEQWQPKATGS